MNIAKVAGTLGRSVLRRGCRAERPAQYAHPRDWSRMTTQFGQSYVRLLWCLVVMILPRCLRARALNLVPGFIVHPTSSIGCSFLCPSGSLVLHPHSAVGHLTFCRGVERLELKRGSRLGHLNWISGWPRGRAHDPFALMSPNRIPELVLEEDAVVTHRHYFDCTDAIRIGQGSGVLGIRSLLLTHTVQLSTGLQSCAPISIGCRCLIATNCVVLGGAALPDYCALGALSLLRDSPGSRYTLYAGNPAVFVRPIATDAGFFQRPRGTA